VFLYFQLANFHWYFSWTIRCQAGYKRIFHGKNDPYSADSEFKFQVPIVLWFWWKFTNSKILSVGVSTLGFATSRGEHRLWDGTGLGGTPSAWSHPTHDNVFLLGMGFTIVHNARKVQKFPFPIVIFRNLNLGGNRPFMVMKVSRILSWDATILHRFCHVKIWVLALIISWKSLTFQHYTMCKMKNV
jgi:hypothetical protein